jgi:RNA polymerase sigma-70 factor (ECF subfamily)
MKRGDWGPMMKAVAGRGRTARGETKEASADGDQGASSEADRLWHEGERENAVAEAHRSYRQRLEAVAFRILRNRTDAEDVVQKVFIALPGVGFEGRASLWTYLYRSVVNGSVNVLRSKRRREAAEERLAHHQLVDDSALGYRPADPEAQVLEGEVLANVAQALLQVRPQHRRVLVLRIMHGLTNTEIAEREGLPLATVGTWLRRGREELRKGLRPVLREMGRND